MRRSLPLALAALTLGFGAFGAGAQDAQVPAQLEGSWRRQPTEARSRSIVASAFEPRLQAFPAMLRGIARDRIAESLPAAQRIDVALRGERVRVVYARDRRVTVETTLGGQTRTQGFDGNWSRATFRLRGGWLEQVNTNDDGRVHRLLSTEPDGQTLHLDVTVHNDRLGGPVRWRIDYRR